MPRVCVQLCQYFCIFDIEYIDKLLGGCSPEMVLTPAGGACEFLVSKFKDQRIAIPKHTVNPIVDNDINIDLSLEFYSLSMQLLLLIFP